MDPTQWSKIWNEQWLKRYVTAQFKKQWAINIKKFTGIQLPGGVTLDGDKLYLEATQEIAVLEDDLQNKSAPLNFMMG
jgi:RES domain-containing protein